MDGLQAWAQHPPASPQDKMAAAPKQGTHRVTGQDDELRSRHCNDRSRTKSSNSKQGDRGRHALQGQTCPAGAPGWGANLPKPPQSKAQKGPKGGQQVLRLGTHPATPCMRIHQHAKASVMFATVSTQHKSQHCPAATQAGGAHIPQSSNTAQAKHQPGPACKSAVVQQHACMSGHSAGAVSVRGHRKGKGNSRQGHASELQYERAPARKSGLAAAQRPLHWQQLHTWQPPRGLLAAKQASMGAGGSTVAEGKARARAAGTPVAGPVPGQLQNVAEWGEPGA